MGAEPVAVSASMSLGPEGIDEEFAGLLDFGDGRHALIASSFTQPYRHEVELLGTAGRIRVPSAFVNRSDPVTVELEDAAGAWTLLEVPGDDEYRLEVEDFARCVSAGRQPQVVSHDGHAREHGRGRRPVRGRTQRPPDHGLVRSPR